MLISKGYNHTVQEHLCLMGVPAYPSLSNDGPFPPFDFESLTQGAVKQLAGNDT